MQIQENTRYRANDNFLLRNVAGDNVLIPIGEVPDPRLENCMITMNESSAFLWRLFSEQPQTETEAIAAAEEEFEAEPGTIASHIRAYMSQYAELGLLVKAE